MMEAVGAPLALTERAKKKLAKRALKVALNAKKPEVKPTVRPELAEIIKQEAEAEAADKLPTGVKGLSDEQKRDKVAALIEELRAADDTDTKKGIRRKLRALGHMGGLRSVTDPAGAEEVVKDAVVKDAKNVPSSPAIANQVVKTNSGPKKGKRALKA